ncbi:hypothetical protein LAV84_18550 [Rhizobium sp. VS19-DR104.2]|uniref:hypothetical protein n=1 Tax=unclassified Rhizobium TaxID=2613769 RepID=UPI001CC791E6|nr:MULTISPECIES: hypothetical protein [unclassified Rhizobium]MBZ5761532.1 hypothetical protein [Rhizobium sp. VS19-DR96]MBZ5767480.1 hypothetical protein [Rhizobium sp. VS19-DR129.2]MBZ5775071.1 hypothetical protein [Rhizobium sp. VS19-DRK62.2]MBZ5785964.1 hypothetical protein [Rhizobium sp. VS19-DR121]MBZ5803390.1 hypothetical protein [Rhizobium sp. VS19-DR181]
MAEISHTAGPWSVDGPVHSIIVYGEDGSRVCFMTSDGPAEANARLIVASPDLLKVMKEALEALRSASRALTEDQKMILMGRAWGWKTLARIEGAIAKAEGRSNG